MLKLLLWILLLGFIFRIIFNYFLPVLRITSVTNDQVRRMQEQMKEMERKMNEQPKQQKKVRRDDDYTDYEELK